MGIPPGVPVTAAKSVGPCPSYCRADCPGTQRPAHPPGACPVVPAAWLPAAALRSYGKYSLSETDVQGSANDANGAKPARVLQEERARPAGFSSSCSQAEQVGLHRSPLTIIATAGHRVFEADGLSSGAVSSDQHIAAHQMRDRRSRPADIGLLGAGDPFGIAVRRLGEALALAGGIPRRTPPGGNVAGRQYNTARTYTQGRRRI